MLITLRDFFHRRRPPRPLDHQWTAARLKVRTHGRKTGIRVGTGPTDAPDEHEGTFARHHRHILNAVRDWFGRRLRAERELRVEARQTWESMRPHDCVATAASRCDELAAAARASLLHGWRETLHAARQLRAFQDANGLVRDARSAPAPILIQGLLAVVIVLEATGNSVFLSVGATGGLVEGLQKALIIAAINVVAGFAVGALLRGLNHPSWIRRGLALGAGSLWAISLVGGHLTVGHYRSALASAPEAAEEVAIQNFVADPMALADFHSWLLVVVGIGTGIAAALTGYRASDPFPGYSAVDERYRQAVEDLRTMKEQYLADLQSAFDLQIGELDRRLGDAIQAVASYRSSLVETKSLAHRYHAVMWSVHVSYEHTIQLYRATVRRVLGSAAPDWPRAAPPTLDDDAPDEGTGLFDAAGFDEEAAPEPSDLREATEQARVQLRELQRAALAQTMAYFGEIELEARSVSTGTERAPAPDPVRPQTDLFFESAPSPQLLQEAGHAAQIQ